MTIEVLAVIPARGGSKGIPRKNLRTVGGLSLVEHAVRSARAAATVTRIVGSTDDEEIAAALRAAGAEVPFLRPPLLATDTTPDAPVFLHALDALAEIDSYLPSLVVNLRPTAPLRTGAHIDDTVQALLDDPACESSRTVSVVTEHPYKMWTSADGRLTPLLPSWHEEHDGDPDVARQLLPPVLRSNGMVDVVRVAALRSTGRFHPGMIAGVVIDDVAIVDIDDEADLRRAEAAINDDQNH
jgi:CMP-N,N'-diacetyllegionaminic acid synthase